MSLYDPDHEADLRADHPSCRLCHGRGVLLDSHGFAGGPREESDCPCREGGEEETEEGPCCTWCGSATPEGPALGVGRDAPLCARCWARECAEAAAAAGGEEKAA